MVVSKSPLSRVCAERGTEMVSSSSNSSGLNSGRVAAEEFETSVASGSSCGDAPS